MIVHGAQSSGGFTKFGEILIDLGTPQFLRSNAGVVSDVSTHSLAIPNDPMSRGLVGYAQMVIVGGGFAELTNAIKLRVN